MTYPRNLVNLANILKIRREVRKPYHLLLTSTISLSPETLQKIAGSKSWEKFCSLMSSLGANDRKALLIQGLGGSAEQAGYQHLAALISAGYFAAVLDTNIDSRLEEALFNIHRSRNEVQSLIIDRDRDEYIVTALDEYRSGSRIIKLRGSLSSNILPERYPEAFEFRQPLRSSLERYLNQDLLVVGEIYRENDISRLMAASGGNLFYVTPSSPAPGDDVIKTIQARGLTKANNVITGEFGDFTKFFTALWKLLKPGSEPLPALEPAPAQEDPVEEMHIPRQASAGSVRRAPSPKRQGRGSARADSLLLKALVQAVSVLLTLVGMGFLLFFISNFLNRTQNVSPGIIIPVIIVCAVIIFGAMGIFNADQISKLFSKMLGASNASPEPEPENKAKQDQKPPS